MTILATQIVRPAHASTSVATTNASTAEYGASDSKTQSAVNAAGWPQQKNNWCGVATISAIAHYLGKSVSQQTVANYLNSSEAVSEWGTPSSNGSPPFKADIAYDVGTDPRSLAAGLTAETGQSTHQLIDMRGAWDATMHLAQDVARTHQPISVIVYHGLHSVLVSDVYATGNPVTDPASVTALVVWDPGFGITNGNIQAAQKVVVPVQDWLTNKYYWASPYNQNHYFGLDEDPDPAVGPYMYDPAKNEMAHLWIGNFVYFPPDASGSPASMLNNQPDWPFNQDGKLIVPITGEVPSGYTGPTYPLVNKWVLSDESIDAPALWTEGAYLPAATSGPVAILAWTGIDRSHHLNVETSTDGITFTNKRILPETSAVHPSVIDVPTGGKDIVVMAWIGTDRQHSLNVVYDVYGSYQKTTFWGETTPYTPTLAWFDNQIWIAWAGTDGNRTLNVMALGPTGNTHGTKTTLWGYDAGSSPALITDARDNEMLLTWQNKDPNHPWFDMLGSTDGVTWKTVIPSPLNQTTIYTPGILAVGTSAPNAGDIDPYYWSWIGTDRNHSINIMKSASLTNWQVAVTTLLDSTPWTAVLGYVGQDHHILMAWTGTDRLHHMNIGQLYE